MKKLFTTPFAMLLCVAMAVVFTACEPEENTEASAKTLVFLCDANSIPNGSTYTTSTLGEDAVFLPGIDLKGDTDGTVCVTVKSLDETMIAICGFGSCQMTLPYLEYTTTASGEINANTPFPLDIHYEPTADKPSASALITAYYEGEEDNAVSFTLVMTNAKGE